MSSVQSADVTLPSRLSFRLETVKSQSITHVTKKGSKIALVTLTKQKIYRLLNTFCIYFVNAKLKEMVKKRR